MTPLITHYNKSGTSSLCKAPTILHKKPAQFCQSSRSGKLDKRSCKEPWAQRGAANWAWNYRVSERNCPHFQHPAISTNIGKGDGGESSHRQNNNVVPGILKILIPIATRKNYQSPRLVQRNFEQTITNPVGISMVALKCSQSVL